MAVKYALPAVFFLILASTPAYALEGSWLFNALNYGRGWYPWACVMENNIGFDKTT